MKPASSQVIRFYPVSFRDASAEETVEAMVTATGEEPLSFVGLNAHTAYLAERDPEFVDVLRESYRFCDGFGIHLLCKLQGLGRPNHRSTPTDFMWEAFEAHATAGKKVFCLGDRPGVAEAFANLLNQRFPGLVCGWHHGFFAIGSAEESAVLAAIRDCAPHLLCVGMGQPRQEKWVHLRRKELRCRAAFHIGASMAFAIGDRRRGPKWATDHGLEWFFRVLAEPRAMFTRYFVEIPWLMARAIGYRIRGTNE